MPLLKPSPAEFGSHVVDLLAKRGVAARFDEQANAISASSGMRLFLANFYTEYCRAALWNRRKVVETYLSVFNTGGSDLPKTLDEAKSALMPKIRERVYTEFLLLNGQIEGRNPMPIQQKIFGGGHLTLEVVFDTPQFTRSIQPERFADWGLSFDDALAIANENLKQRSLNGGFEVVRPGMYRSTWRDTFDASRLHLSDFVTMLDVKGRPVAMAPNRDTLIITGEEDAEGLAGMAKIAEATLQQPRAMTGYAFRLDSGWIPFLPPVDHPAYAALKTLAVDSESNHQSEQTAMLTALNEKDGVDLFVASPIVVARKGNEPARSIASWADAVDSLLPRTDDIAFSTTSMEGKRELLGLAPWDDVIRIVPTLLQPQGMYPERYRTRGYPTKDELASIAPKLPTSS